MRCRSKNVETVRAINEPLDGIDVAAIDWSTDAIREVLGAAYSSDIELTTLASGLGSGVGEFYRGLDGLARYLQEWLDLFSEYHVANLAIGQYASPSRPYGPSPC